jgi:hypothetical protein
MKENVKRGISKMKMAMSRYMREGRKLNRRHFETNPLSAKLLNIS